MGSGVDVSVGVPVAVGIGVGVRVEIGVSVGTAVEQALTRAMANEQSSNPLGKAARIETRNAEIIFITSVNSIAAHFIALRE